MEASPTPVKIETSTNVEKIVEKSIKPVSKPSKSEFTQWIIVGIILLLGIFGGILISINVANTKINNATASTNSSGSLLATPTPAKVTDLPLIVTATPMPTTTYIQVKEMGVKFILPDDVKDLYYKYSDKYGPVASFSSDSLATLDKRCSGDLDSGYTALGALERHNGDPTTETVLDSSYIKKVGNYYYYFSEPQANCSNNASVMEVQKKQLAAVEKSIMVSLELQ